MSAEQNGATVLFLFQYPALFLSAYVQHVQREQHSLLQKQIKPPGFKHDSKAGGCEVDKMKRNVQVRMSAVSVKSISTDRRHVTFGTMCFNMLSLAKPPSSDESNRLTRKRRTQPCFGGIKSVWNKLSADGQQRSGS
ncbi:hypothetical protein Q5P01_009675 [Channa striata]|uniref:Uncharacterized protein n=1 Tax=Channa striata TaxID=64152 RepID=A0AA88N160_CHASR|nr:hypothetical protein Q5P01_009675 [Channa striata]